METKGSMAAVKKHYFWPLCGLVVVATLVIFFLAWSAYMISQALKTSSSTNPVFLSIIRGLSGLG